MAGGGKNGGLEEFKQGSIDFSHSVNRRQRYVGKIIWKANAETAVEEG